MRARLLFGLAATIAVAGCSDLSSAPQQARPGVRSADDILTCRSGYHIATRADGTTYCEPDAGMNAPSRPTPPSSR